MDLTEEQRIQLETVLNIVTDQIPNYFNLVNSSSQDWDIENVNDCVFGMMFNSFISKSTEYLKNEIIDKDKDAKLEAKFDYFELAMNFFSENVPKIKQVIVSTTKS